MARSSFGLSVMNTARGPRGGAGPPALRPAFRPAPGPRRPLPSRAPRAAVRMTDADRPPLDGRPASAAGLTSLAWTPSDPAPPLYGAVAAAGPRSRPGGSLTARPGPVSRRGPGCRPLLRQPGPRGSHSIQRGPGSLPPLAASRRPAVPVGLAACRQGPDWSPPPLPQPGGPCRLPMRPRRGCRTAVPSYVSPAPAPFPVLRK